MKLTSPSARLLLAGAAALLLPATASAQDTVTANNVIVENVVEADNTGAPYDNVTTTEDGDDDDFPWGLLGLLGLAGLFGLKRNDDARDIHVDARRDTRA